jgi:hypothetical protein
MSSRIKWGGIAGIAAAALFIVSAILEQLSPLQRIYDSVASYLYLGVVVAPTSRSSLPCSGFTPCTAEGRGTADWGPPERCSPSLVT